MSTASDALDVTSSTATARPPAYDVFLEPKLRRVLPDANANGVRILANAGGLDVDGAANAAAAITPAVANLPKPRKLGKCAVIS